jgi:hypothetical protein
VCTMWTGTPLAPKNARTREQAGFMLEHFRFTWGPAPRVGSFRAGLQGVRMRRAGAPAAALLAVTVAPCRGALCVVSWSAQKASVHAGPAARGGARRQAARPA